MDGLQNHIITLEKKIDQLYAIVEYLSHCIGETLPDSEMVSDQSAAKRWELDSQLINERSQEDNTAVNKPFPNTHHRGFNAMMEHKDILLDDKNYVPKTTTPHGEEVSSEIQIRRLHTQLTAAYERIAALEEQLLAQRIHF